MRSFRCGHFDVTAFKRFKYKQPNLRHIVLNFKSTKINTAKQEFYYEHDWKVHPYGKVC